MSIKIDITQVSELCNRIKTTNNEMYEEFDSLSKKIRTINECWSGTMIDEILNLYNNIESNYKDARFEVIKNLTSIFDLASEQYDNTEMQVESNASKFK